MIIQLSQYIALEISTDLYYRSIDEEPLLHIYNLGDNYNEIHITESDSGENNRQYTYAPTLNNTIINSTSGFYFDELLGLDYDSAKITNYLTSELVSKLQFRKCRLLFVSGFGYEPVNGIAGVSYRGYVMTANGTVDLFSLFDTYDDTRILPTTPTLYENVLYNAAIDFYMLDIDSLYAANTPDLTELRTSLFGETHPQVVYFNHSLFKLDEISDFTYNSKGWNKFVFDQIYKQNQSMISADTDFFVAIDLNDKAVEFKLSHTERNAGAYIINVSAEGYEDSIEVVYQVVSSQYDTSGDLLATETLEINRITDKFNTIRLIPDITQADSDHMVIQITCVVTADNGFMLTRSSEMNITDLDIYKTQELGLTLTEDKVYNQNTTNINVIEPESTVPSVVYMLSPIYIQSYAANNITLYPYKQTVVIVTETDVSSLSSAKLVIGSLVYYSNSNVLSYTIDAKAYYSSSTNYYIMTTDNEVVVSGKINRIIE